MIAVIQNPGRLLRFERVHKQSTLSDRKRKRLPLAMSDLAPFPSKIDLLRSCVLCSAEAEVINDVENSRERRLGWKLFPKSNTAPSAVLLVRMNNRVLVPWRFLLQVKAAPSLSFPLPTSLPPSLSVCMPPGHSVL